jgi:hypothetical protein
MLKKICSKCSIEKEYTEFHKKSTCVGGVNSRCKECIKKPKKIKIVPTTSKICAKCKIDKIFSEYGNNKYGLLGLAYWCRECKKEDRVRVYEKNRKIGFLDKSNKICTTCKIEKNADEFHKSYNSCKGYASQCKSCKSRERKLRYKKKKLENKRKVTNKICRSCNTDKKESAYHKDINMLDGLSRICKKCKSVFAKKDYKDNKGEYIKRNSEYKKMKYHTDDLFRMMIKTYSSIKSSYKRSGFQKESRTKEILGKGWLEFRKYLEDNFYGFKIGDKGLDLDHIVPVSSVSDKEEALKINHYTNFQLLPSYYNRYIKRGNLWDKEDFEKWLDNNPQKSNTNYSY